MKKIYVIDGNVIEKSYSFSKNKTFKKSYRYILFIITNNKVIDNEYFLLGFGIGMNTNRKYITKKSIIILLYFLTKLLIVEDKIYQNINYSVDIGNLDNFDIIEKIKNKHKVINVKKEFIIELEDNIINDFLYYYFNYGKKK